jgi:hypothetical protein
VAEVYGRKIRHDLRPGTSAHLYLPGPHLGVWNLAADHDAWRRGLCRPARIGDEDNILPEYQVPFIVWTGVHLSN